jgi:phage terminase large subunit GpA-like protein
MMELSLKVGAVAAATLKRAFSAWAPPPKLTISEWADTYRRLSPESAAEPGNWLTSRAEYQRGIMDAISDPLAETVVLMTSSQVGKTEILNNVVGYYIHQDPAPILNIQPTLEMAKTWSKDRLAPMLRDTPALRGKVREPRERDSGNTVIHKIFPGGHISMAGANSAASLASRPIRVLLADEVDRYPASAGTGGKATEGDPVRLGVKRTTAFWNRKIVLASTPTIKGSSRIEAEWDLSDQRRFFVPCPHCSAMHYLKWAQVRWPTGEPTKAAYSCEECGADWTEGQRLSAIRHGEWRATAKGNGRVVGFHLNEIYSPWSTPAKMALDFVEAKGDPEKVKTFVNTSLGESWEQDAEKVDAQAVVSRLEEWGAPRAPNDVLVVTVGVDTQDDRLELERVGWGPGEESWSLDHQILYGDPSAPDLWNELDAYLLTPTYRLDGTRLPVHAAAIDSGGHYTQQVYKFANARLRRRVYAVKGIGGPGRTAWPKRASTVPKGKVFIVGVDTAKDIIYARLKMTERGAGFMHFPIKDGKEPRDRAYFDQLTAEVVVTKFSKGFAHREYQLPTHRRNEALDLRVYAYCVLQSLNVRWGAAKVAVLKKPEPEDDPDLPETEEATASPPPPPVSAPPPASRRKPEVLKRGAIPRRKGWLR